MGVSQRRPGQGRRLLRGQRPASVTRGSGPAACSSAPAPAQPAVAGCVTPPRVC